MPHMKRALLLLASLLLASSSTAGVTYEFESVTSGLTAQKVSGTVKAEGSALRMELARGDGILFQDGAVVLSTDGGKTLTVADPRAKTFYIIDIADVLGGADSMIAQFGALVSVRDPKVSVRHGGAAGKLAGYPVRKSSVESTYLIDVKAIGEKLPIRMRLTTDVWWTDRLGPEFTNFLQMRGLRTGIDAVDKVLASQTAAIQGFPLKQITRTEVTMNRNTMRSTSTSTVSGLRTTPIKPSEFTLGRDYRRTESPIQRLMKRGTSFRAP